MKVRYIVGSHVGGVRMENADRLLKINYEKHDDVQFKVNRFRERCLDLYDYCLSSKHLILYILNPSIDLMSLRSIGLHS